VRLGFLFFASYLLLMSGAGCRFRTGHL